MKVTPKDMEIMMQAIADLNELSGKYQQLRAENKRLITQNEKLIAALTPVHDGQAK